MMIKKTSGQKAKKWPLEMENNISTSSIVSFSFPIWISRKKITASILFPKVDLSHQEQKVLVIIAHYLASKFCQFTSLFCFQEWHVRSMFIWNAAGCSIVTCSSESQVKRMEWRVLKNTKRVLLWTSLYKDPLWSDSLAQGFHRSHNCSNSITRSSCEEIL